MFDSHCPFCSSRDIVELFPRNPMFLSRWSCGNCGASFATPKYVYNPDHDREDDPDEPFEYADEYDGLRGDYDPDTDMLNDGAL